MLKITIFVKIFNMCLIPVIHNHNKPIFITYVIIQYAEIITYVIVYYPEIIIKVIGWDSKQPYFPQ